MSKQMYLLSIYQILSEKGIFRKKKKEIFEIKNENNLNLEKSQGLS